MNFSIEVLSVVGPVKNQKGKNSWEVMEIAYKKDGKIEGKKVVSFNSPEVFKLVGQAKQGEVYIVTAEKINDFWQWTGFTKQDGAAAQTPSQGATGAAESNKGVEIAKEPASGRSSGRVTGSNYETPEERVVKQRYIARQSSLGYALSYFELNSKVATVEEVEALAERFVAFVYEKPSAVEGLINMGDDIPF